MRGEQTISFLLMYYEPGICSLYPPGFLSGMSCSSFLTLSNIFHLCLLEGTKDDACGIQERQCASAERPTLNSLEEIYIYIHSIDSKCRRSVQVR